MKRFQHAFTSFESHSLNFLAPSLSLLITKFNWFCKLIVHYFLTCWDLLDDKRSRAHSPLLSNKQNIRTEKKKNQKSIHIEYACAVGSHIRSYLFIKELHLSTSPQTYSFEFRKKVVPIFLYQSSKQNSNDFLLV